MLDMCNLIIFFNSLEIYARIFFHLFKLQQQQPLAVKEKINKQTKILIFRYCVLNNWITLIYLGISVCKTCRH